MHNPGRGEACVPRNEYTCGLRNEEESPCNIRGTRPPLNEEAGSWFMKWCMYPGDDNFGHRLDPDLMVKLLHTPEN